MDSLADIWEQFGNTIAAILAVIALLKSTSKEVQQLGSGFWNWKGWTIIAKIYRNTNARYRERIAKGVMRRTLEESDLRIGIRTYDSCLWEDSGKSVRAQLERITPAKPSWLNDYYVATALEALSTEGSVVKAKGYSFQSWPPKPETYYFAIVNAGKSAREETARIETDSICNVYQSFGDCQKDSRFEGKRFAETISPRETRFNTTYSLKDMAPPCDLCWEKEGRERDIRALVDSITKYDLAVIATPEITGTNEELQGAVADTCIESQCPAEVDMIKLVIKRAIELRQEQITRCTSRSQYEWLQREKEELAVTLKEYIKSQTIK